MDNCVEGTGFLIFLAIPGTFQSFPFGLEKLLVEKIKNKAVKTIVKKVRFYCVVFISTLIKFNYNIYIVIVLINATIMPK